MREKAKEGRFGSFGNSKKVVTFAEKKDDMIRTVFTPSSNFVNVSIPDQYIGTELEIMVLPIKEVSNLKFKKKLNNQIDHSFGSWAGMDKSTEDICAEIRNSRSFRKRDITL